MHDGNLPILLGAMVSYVYDEKKLHQ